MNFFDFLKHFNIQFVVFLVFPALITFGLYLTLRLRCLQVSRLKMSFLNLFKKDAEGEGSLSHYEVVAAVLAGNFGTGNISGIAVALATGGPGALVWMWVMAFFGSIIQYASCLLGVKYRKKKENGEYAGGPMYYLSQGLGWKKMASAFAIVALIASLTAGVFVQTNSMVLPLHRFGIPAWVGGGVIALLVGAVILGGSKRIASVCASVVPLMALLYGGTALVILIGAWEKLPAAVSLMLRSAWGGAPLLGGAAGYAFMHVLTAGFDRGIFATDAGTGLAPILQAEAKSHSPVVNGVIALVAPLLVMIVCTMTALVLIVTGAWESGLQSTNQVAFAFTQGLKWQGGSPIVLIALLLFGYTTILSWAFCFERVVEFLFGLSRVRLFQFLFLAFIPLGTMLHVDVVWLIADLALAAMLLINLTGLTALSGEVLRESRAFFQPHLLPKN